MYRYQGLTTELKLNKSGIRHHAEVSENLITCGHAQICTSARQVSLPLRALRGLHALQRWRYEKEEVSTQKLGAGWKKKNDLSRVTSLDLDDVLGALKISTLHQAVKVK